MNDIPILFDLFYDLYNMLIPVYTQFSWNGVATIGTLLEITCLFCSYDW